MKIEKEKTQNPMKRQMVCNNLIKTSFIEIMKDNFIA